MVWKDDNFHTLTHCFLSFVDVKPTNVLIDKKGVVKLCDFGVSGQLEKSIAKTNIGCQSYMAVGHLSILSSSISVLTSLV